MRSKWGGYRLDGIGIGLVLCEIPSSGGRVGYPRSRTGREARLVILGRWGEEFGYFWQADVLRKLHSIKHL